MKMKKFVSLLLCGVIGISTILTGCSKNQDGANEKVSSTKGDNQTTESKEVDKTTEGDTIKIGVSIALTGTAAALGEDAQRSLNIALDEINAAGGVKGKQVELIVYDDKNEPEQALKNVTKLIEQDKVTAIFGPFSSNSCMAVGAYIEEAGVPTIAPPVGVAWLRQGWTYMFRPTSNTYVQTTQAYDMIKKNDYKKIAILNINEEYGNNSKKDIINLIKEDGDQVEVVVEEVYKDGDTDLTAQAVKIAQSDCDALFVVAWSNDVGNILKQVRNAGYEGPVIGDNALTAPAVREVGGTATDNCYFTAAYILPDDVDAIDNDPNFSGELINKFLHTFNDKYNALPIDDNAYRAYDAMNILATAMEDVESLDHKSIRDSLANLHDYEAIVGTMDYRDNEGEGIAVCKTWKISDGKISAYEY